jgi:hypothetical protein
LNGGQEVSGELIIAGGDASEILEPAKAAFDDIASLVGAFVEAVEGCSVGLVRNDGDCAAAEDVGAEGVTIVALVGDEYAHRRSEVQKGRRDRDVGILSRSEMECARSAIRVAQGVDFRGASAARAADRLFMLPPFPPLAERCALIEVESMDRVTLSLPQLASASKIACHRPRLAQRLKRL